MRISDWSSDVCSSDLIELHGDCAGFFRILSCQQTDAKVGFADASTRIDAWPQGEAEIGANRRPLETGGLDQCSHADIAALSHDLQTLRDKGTVQSATRGDVGNRAECNQIQQINEARFGTLVKIAASTQFTEPCRAPTERSEAPTSELQ